MKVVLLMRMDPALLAETGPGIEVVSSDGEGLLEAGY